MQNLRHYDVVAIAPVVIDRALFVNKDDKRCDTIYRDDLFVKRAGEESAGWGVVEPQEARDIRKN